MRVRDAETAPAGERLTADIVRVRESRSGEGRREDATEGEEEMTATMTDGEALFRGVVAEPDNIAARHVFVDWLMEEFAGCDGEAFYRANDKTDFSTWASMDRGNSRYVAVAPFGMGSLASEVWIPFNEWHSTETPGKLLALFDVLDKGKR